MRELEAIRRDIELLRASKRARKVFGAEVHEYELNAPLSEREVVGFEKSHRIHLPADYRAFLIHVGNGGAGPAYGVFKLGEMDDGFAYARWRENKDLVGCLRKPFPHVKPWNDLDGEPEYDPSKKGDEEYEDAFEARLDRWEQTHYWSPRQVDGALPLCHLGCACRIWLVVTGNEAGHVWSDDRADRKGLRPLATRSAKRISFLAWYLAWLNGALRTARIRRPK